MASRSVSRDSALQMRRFCASVNFRRAARVVTRHYDAALRAAGITATQLPLLAAISSGTNTSITALAATLDLERSTISREIDHLERRGLIATVGSTADRRATALELTPRGRRTLSTAYRAWQRAHDAILGAYGQKRFETLLEQTRELGKSVKALGKRR
jgi:DNA-binding MarR family transcriptional regulator